MMEAQTGLCLMVVGAGFGVQVRILTSQCLVGQTV